MEKQRKGRREERGRQRENNIRKVRKKEGRIKEAWGGVRREKLGKREGSEERWKGRVKEVIFSLESHQKS